jgi:hypothetical protein
MTISELPEDIQKIALLRQQEQGNKPDVTLDLNLCQIGGNFNWDETLEGTDIWENLYYASNNAIEEFREFHRSRSFDFKIDLI